MSKYNSAKRTEYLPSSRDAHGNLTSVDEPFSFLASHAKLPKLPQEVESGHVEYKLNLRGNGRLPHLITQLQWRLSEGQGEALYLIGVSDNGDLVGLNSAEWAATWGVLSAMAEGAEANVAVINERVVLASPSACLSDIMARDFPVEISDSETSDSKTARSIRRVREVLFRKSKERQFVEIRVAILGCEGAGKSTLLGTLTHSTLDNGRGLTRLNTLRHRHEIESGRSSSISSAIIGFDSAGSVVNYGGVGASPSNNASARATTWEEICILSCKVVTFLDTCGSPKYLKTTISGLTGRQPDFCCLLLPSNLGGVNTITQEHLALTIMLNIPTFVVITKVDIADSVKLTATVQGLLGLLKGPGCRRVPLVVGGWDEVVLAANSFSSHSSFSSNLKFGATEGGIIPIFLCSAVTGEGLELLMKFLNLLPARFGVDGSPPVPLSSESGDNGANPSSPTSASATPAHTKWEDEDTEIQVEEVYSVADVGPVLLGLLHAGFLSLSIVSAETDLSSSISSSASSLSPLQTSTSLFLGPDHTNSFHLVKVPSIHRQRIAVRLAKRGEIVTMSIQSISKRLRWTESATPATPRQDNKIAGKRKRKSTTLVAKISGEDSVEEAAPSPPSPSPITTAPTKSAKAKDQLQPHHHTHIKSEITVSASCCPIPIVTLPTRTRKAGSGNSGQGDNSGSFFWRTDNADLGKAGMGNSEADIEDATFLDPPSTSSPPKPAIKSSPSPTHNLPLKLRKGLILLSPSHPSLKISPDGSTASSSQSSFLFEADIHVLYADTPLAVGSCGTVHVGSVRQWSRIVKIFPDASSLPHPIPTPPLQPAQPADSFDNWGISTIPDLEAAVSDLNETGTRPPTAVGLTTGQRGHVIVRFAYEPEWLKPGWTILFRHGRLKCVGRVLRVLSM